MTDSGKLGLMLDIESLDLGPRSVILQVGAIAYPLDDPETEQRRIDQYLPVQPQIALGRTFSWSTMRWWMGQDDKARSRFVDNDGNDMDELTAIVRSIHKKIADVIAGVGRQNIEVWAKGPQFDIVNLETLFADCGLTTPWLYDSVMDLRTLMRLADVHTENVDKSGIVEHVAVSDAQFQIRCYAEAMRQLRSNK
jgi:hypothetical protein